VRRLGRQLTATGAVLFAGYCALVWFDVFGHNDDAPVCFGMPHQDWFFPPATVCSPAADRTTIATSTLTTAAGTVLFVLAVGTLLTGSALLLRSRSARHRIRSTPTRHVRRAPATRLYRPVPGTSWSPGARSHALPPASGRSLTPTPEPDGAPAPTGGARH
jgi:hypothetical protein